MPEPSCRHCCQLCPTVCAYRWTWAATQCVDHLLHIGLRFFVSWKYRNASKPANNVYQAFLAFTQQFPFGTTQSQLSPTITPAGIPFTFPLHLARFISWNYIYHWLWNSMICLSLLLTPTLLFARLYDRSLWVEQFQCWAVYSIYLKICDECIFFCNFLVRNMWRPGPFTMQMEQLTLRVHVLMFSMQIFD